MAAPIPVSVSGNLNSLLGANAAGSYVQFVLINQGSAIPYVPGATSIVGPIVTMQADSNGNIAGELWGNDVISPAGTQYRVWIGTEFGIYNVVGSFWNLNTATPANAPPSGAVTLPNAEEPLIVEITGVPADGGDFTLPHSLGYVPRGVVFQITSLDILVYQSTYYDADNLYLNASSGGLTGQVLLW
jgi:hypothetical protein